MAAAVCARASTVADSFVLPGVDAADIRLESGRWCRYIVVDEAMGEVDSTSFYIAVLGHQSVRVDGVHADDTRADEAYWVEFESSPVGAPSGERDVTKALISSKIKDYAYGDSLYRYVYEMYIKKGDEPVQPADPYDLKQVTLANPTSESDWIRHPDSTVSTPMGPIVSTWKELTVEEAREIPTGRVTLLQHNVDRFRVWSSEEVPIFSLVKCVIERSRESKTVPAVPGIPTAGARESRTTAVIVDFGDGARPILSVP